MVIYGASITDIGKVEQKAEMGDIVWVRDPFHSSYQRFGKAIFTKVEPCLYGGRSPYVVRFMDRDGNPTMIYGIFPEIRLTEPSEDECLPRKKD